MWNNVFDRFSKPFTESAKCSINKVNGLMNWWRMNNVNIYHLYFHLFSLQSDLWISCLRSNEKEIRIKHFLSLESGTFTPPTILIRLRFKGTAPVWIWNASLLNKGSLEIIRNWVFVTNSDFLSYPYIWAILIL